MPEGRRSLISRVLRPVVLAGIVYACWLGMMLVHEFGHVVHAWLSGAKVTHVAVPLFGFSRTELAGNPRPLFVAWGGPIWGCVLPLLMLAAARFVPSRPRSVAVFFAGLCLIANGAYLTVGSFLLAGDAGDLIRYGAPQWALLAFGAVTMPAGLYLWHLLGPRFGIRQKPEP